MENKITTWHSREFVYYEKSTGWYITFTAIILMLIAYNIFLKDYFAALTFFLIGLATWYFAQIKPSIVEVSISDKGIYFDETHIPYASIKRFWIVHHQKAKALHLETTAYLNRFMVIQLEDQDPEVIRDILIEFIPQTPDNEETLTRRLARKFKF